MLNGWRPEFGGNSPDNFLLLVFDLWSQVNAIIPYPEWHLAVCLGGKQRQKLQTVESKVQNFKANVADNQLV